MVQVSAKVTLGPVLFLWQGEKWRDFYYWIADEAPVSHVTIGESICSKRSHFTDPFMDKVIERLLRAGKQVSLASLALVMLEREAKYVRQTIQRTKLPVEANDLSALHLLAGRRHSIGPMVNVYNAATANLLAERGADNICLSPELPLSSIQAIIETGPKIDYEVLAFGRAPLAISARCAHARSKGRIKDNCQFVCGAEPDGMPVNTLDRQPFLALNGVQTLSYTCHSAICDLDILVQAGVSRFRLSPQDCDMVAVAELYHNVLQGQLAGEAAEAQLRQLYPAAPLSNGFLHGPTGAAWTARYRSVTAGAA